MLKSLRKGLTQLRDKCGLNQEYGIIVKEDGQYHCWYFKLAKNENVSANLVNKYKSMEIVEIVRIPQDFTKPKLQKRVDLLNRRETDTQKKHNRLAKRTPS